MSSRVKQLLIGVLLVMLIAGSVVGGMYCYRHFETKLIKTDDSQNSQATDYDVYFDGEPYAYNYSLTNILFLGIDNDAPLSYENIPGRAGQADCIMILSVNKETEETRILQISRDTMTSVDIYDSNGSYYTTIQSQLATQFAYGNGVEGSCWATKRTVKELLYDLPIHGYIAVDIAAISEINDLLGGVNLTMQEDYTEIDPAFQKGATLTMTGEQAEKFVRYRDTAVIGSNNARMERQVQFIPAMLDAFHKKASEGEETLDHFFEQVSPYLHTDMGSDDIYGMSKYSWATEQVVFAPGKSQAGEQFEEFYLDEEKLKKIMIEMFYKPKK